MANPVSICGICIRVHFDGNNFKNLIIEYLFINW